jgi:hypothetical protein
MTFTVQLLRQVPKHPYHKGDSEDKGQEDQSIEIIWMDHAAPPRDVIRLMIQ